MGPSPGRVMRLKRLFLATVSVALLISCSEDASLPGDDHSNENSSLRPSVTYNANGTMNIDTATCKVMGAQVCPPWAPLDLAKCGCQPMAVDGGTCPAAICGGFSVWDSVTCRCFCPTPPPACPPSAPIWDAARCHCLTARPDAGATCHEG